MHYIQCSLSQINRAVTKESARYILTAIIDGVNHDAGEMNIYTNSDVIKTRDKILSIAAEKLKRLSLTAAQIDRAVVTIQVAPALY